jgi:hypothetical protein
LPYCKNTYGLSKDLRGRGGKKMIKKMWVCIFNNKIKNCYAKGVFHSKVFPKKEYAETWWKEHYGGKSVIKQVTITDEDPFENVREAIHKNKLCENPSMQQRCVLLAKITEALIKDLKNFDKGAG